MLASGLRISCDSPDIISPRAASLSIPAELALHLAPARELRRHVVEAADKLRKFEGEKSDCGTRTDFPAAISRHIHVSRRSGRVRI